MIVRVMMLVLLASALAACETDSGSRRTGTVVFLSSETLYDGSILVSGTLITLQPENGEAVTRAAIIERLAELGIDKLRVDRDVVSRDGTISFGRRTAGGGMEPVGDSYVSFNGSINGWPAGSALAPEGKPLLDVRAGLAAARERLAGVERRTCPSGEACDPLSTLLSAVRKAGRE